LVEGAAITYLKLETDIFCEHFWANKLCEMEHNLFPHFRNFTKPRFRTTSKKFQNNFEKNPKKFRKKFRKNFEKISKKFRNFFEKFQKKTRNFTKPRFRKISKKFRKMHATYDIEMLLEVNGTKFRESSWHIIRHSQPGRAV
jgi:hypothetical protein